MRVYDEVVDVRVHPAGPVAFLWRQRLYVVREVLDRWRERDAWWLRDGIRLRDLTERQVWRVRASRGRASGVGVFDLAEPVPVEVPVPVAYAARTGAVPGPISSTRAVSWRLLRAAD